MISDNRAVAGLPAGIGVHMDAIMFEWLMGAVFVGVNTFRRYNTPISNRESTTFQNFSFYFLCYFLSILVLYVLFGALLDSSPETISALYQALSLNISATIPANLEKLSAPMVSALFLTTLLPSLPWLSRYDNALLQLFWDRGHIPNHVQKMAATMRRAPFNFSPSQNKYILNLCQPLKIDHEQLTLKATGSLDFRWARINALIASIHSWKDDDSGRLRRYMQEHREEFNKLVAQCEEINNEFTELKAQQLEPHTLDKIERFVDKSITEVFRGITVFIAKAVCISELSESGRSSRVSQLGVEGGTSGLDQLSPGQLAQALSAIVLIFLLVSTVQELYKPAEYRKFGNVFFMTFLMMFSYGVALIIALDLRTRVGMGYNELTRHRSWLSYFIVGVVTVFSWIIVSISYRYIPLMLTDSGSNDNLQQVISTLSWNYPYALQSLALAVSISWVLDYHQSGGPSNKLTLNKRLYYAAFVTATISVASLIAFYWMEGLGVFEGFATKDMDFRGKTHMGWFIFKGAAVGAVVGWLVPMWYHLNRSSAPDHIAGRLISMNKRALDKEIRTLAPNELVAVVSAVGASIAAIDDNVNKSELDVYLIICSQLAGLRNSDVDTDVAEIEFNRCVEQIEKQQLDLQQRLQKIAHLPRLSSLLPFIATSIAFADGVYLDQEKHMVETIVNHLQLKC
jgi:tellurite resistance protein